MSAPDAPIPRRLVRAEQVLAARTRRVAVVLEGSQDPHNVHAVLRTAEALGVQDVHLVAPRGEAAAIASGVTQRSHEWLTVARHATIDAAVAACRAEGRAILAAHVDERAESLTGLAHEGPVAVVLGNETEGLSPRALELCNRTFRIDLVGFTGSLNLSVAAAIVMWELRRTDVVSARPGDLPPPERDALRRTWLAKLVPDRAEEWLARTGELERAAEASTRVVPVDRTPRRGPGRG